MNHACINVEVSCVHMAVRQLNPNSTASNPKAVSCAGIAVRRTASLRSPMTRASIRCCGAEQSYDLKSLHSLMDPRVKPGGDIVLVARFGLRKRMAFKALATCCPSQAPRLQRCDRRWCSRSPCQSRTPPRAQRRVQCRRGSCCGSIPERWFVVCMQADARSWLSPSCTMNSPNGLAVPSPVRVTESLECPVLPPKWPSSERDRPA
jgi:hypothetical protein